MRALKNAVACVFILLALYPSDFCSWKQYFPRKLNADYTYADTAFGMQSAKKKIEIVSAYVKWLKYSQICVFESALKTTKGIA